MAASIKWLATPFVLACTIALASPAFAQHRDIWVGQDGAVHISRERTAALQYCNWIAGAFYPEVENDHNRDSYYRACMAAQGQLE